MAEMRAVLHAWTMYLKTVKDWQALVAGVEAKQTGCGPVYELPNPIDRPNESFAIADMRQLKIAEPHYHAGGETEIYVVLQGSGTVVTGGKEERVVPGMVVVAPPDTTHFTIPEKDLVLAVINTPPFRAENVVVVHQTDRRVGFDAAQFKRLSPSR